VEARCKWKQRMHPARSTPEPGRFLFRLLAAREPASRSFDGHYSQVKKIRVIEE
jgi:hypothetical protein